MLLVILSLILLLNIFILKQNLIIKKQNKKMSVDLTTIQAQNTALIANVAALDTVEASAVKLLTDLNAGNVALQKQLADAIAANDPVAIQAVSDSMAASNADIASKTQELATAVTVNTVAA